MAGNMMWGPGVEVQDPALGVSAIPTVEEMLVVP